MKNMKEVPINAHSEEIRPPSNARRPVAIIYAQTPDAARRMIMFIIFTVVFPTPMSAATPESTSSITKVIIAEAAIPITILNQILYLKSDIPFIVPEIKYARKHAIMPWENFCLRKVIFARQRKILPAQKLIQKNKKRVKKAAESTNNRLIGRLLYILSFKYIYFSVYI